VSATTPFDDIIRRLDTPLVVVTTAANGQRSGCLVGFHCQCSIEPLQYAVWISAANFTHHVAVDASVVAVHFLDEADHDLAELFGGETGDVVDKFASCEWTEGPGGVPLLDRARNRIVLERTALVDAGGDHVCFVGAPVETTSSGNIRPLRLTDADDIEPGHSATNDD